MIGSTVVVTGAGSGIGLAVAERLGRDGLHVVCADLVGRGHVAVQAVVAAGGSAEAADVDVSRRQDWEALAGTLAERETQLSGLVNNAGIVRDSVLTKMTDEQFDAVIDVHLKGTWLGCQILMPLLRKSAGAIVNVSSSGRHGSFGQSNYAAAKAGIVGLTRSVALESARYGVRCNAVAPGAVNTPMVSAVPEATRLRWLESIALNRFGEPAEIAGAVSFLLSEDASYITGHILDVNGLEQHP